MGQPAGSHPVGTDGVGAERPATSAAASAEFQELRQLLVGPELEQWAVVEDRLNDPARRAEDLAQVLPEAIKAARVRKLTEALEPVFEKSFHSSVRRNPRALADAIYPIIGPAIRSSVTAAIRDFAETLNQIVEKSVSFRAIRWRIESIVTGKPFSEILLSRSLLYSVEQVFLIHRKSGLLLQHAAAKGSVLKDADMISGMLTAIQDFLADSFAEGGQELETVDVGRFKLWLTYGPEILLVAAVSGTAPVELKQVFRKTLDEIEQTLQKEIASFKQDDVSVFEPARPLLEKCLMGRCEPDKQNTGRRLWIYAAVIAAAIAVFLAYQARQRGRWNNYFAELKQQPGILITSIERHGSSYLISGLRDPLAPDPAGSLQARGLDPAKAAFHLDPYLSVNTPFAARRELDAAGELIGKRIIRFDTGSSKLTPGEADRIEEIAAAVKRLLMARPGATVVVAGHADDTGTFATNQKLSLERANRVTEAFTALGVPERALSVVGEATQPLRQGSTPWDRSLNRSVSFQVQPSSPPPKK